MTNAVPRNAGATYFLPSENEWYKAAYYDPNKPGGAGYWTYPTKSNTLPSNVLSATGTNNANFVLNGVYTDPTNMLTPVGTFAASPGPYGTYDMGGDIWQWIEDPKGAYRGGGYEGLASSEQSGGQPPSVGQFDPYLGFRVASVPEPGSITLLVVGAIAALIWRRGRK